MKNFLIYRSSAGSGKTYTLVKEYLKQVLSNPEDYRHTLAITFTNKAAEEMKSRIINSLSSLAEGKDPDLKKTLTDEGVKCSIEFTSADVLSRILHNYTDFSVSTIDSFFQKVIRSFARELKLHLGYTIELDTDIVLDKVVDEIFAMIGEDAGLTEYIEEFTFQSMDEDKGWRIERSIKELAGEIFKERYWQKKESTESDIIDNRVKIKEFVDLLKNFRFKFENYLIKHAKEALKIIDSNGLEVQDFKRKNTSAAAYLQKLSKKETYLDLSGFEPYNLTYKIAEGINEWYTKDSPKKQLIQKAIDEGLEELVVKIVRFYDSNIKKYVSVRIVLKSIYTIGIFSDVIEKLRQYRDDNRVLLISDAGNMLKSVISEDNSSFVYEKVGSYYKNFLIDEFQDTSTFQWQSLLPLVINSLSERNFSMVVGDVKQSIYRWRNGNMMLLLKDIENDLAHYEEMIESIPLETNFRSKSNIIEFNNKVFQLAPEFIAEGIESDRAQVIKDSYREAQQKEKPGTSGGYIKVKFIPYDKQADSGTYEAAGQKMLEIVAQLMNEKYRASDILILARNKDEIRDAAALLTNAGYDAVSDESLLLINSPKVKLILSLFRYLSDRTDKFAMTEALYNYALVNGEKMASDRIFSKSEIQSGVHFDMIFKDLFTDNGNSEDKSKRRINSSLFRQNLYELTEFLIRILGLNTRADLYLTGFLDVILEYSSKNSPDIRSFVDWWEQHYSEYSISAAEQIDSIRVMTIHKAKGLESRAVIIPFANWDTELSGNRDNIWVSSSVSPFDNSSSYLVKAVKDLEESHFAGDYRFEQVMTKLDNLNLMYVAFTRARETLYVISPQKGSRKDNINGLLSKLFEYDDWLKNHKKSDHVFEFGEKVKSTGEKYKTKVELLTSRALTSVDFRDRIVIKPVHEHVKFERVENYYDAKNRGIVLHKALSFILTESDIKRAALKIKEMGLITEKQLTELENELKRIVCGERTNAWFDKAAEIRTEQEIITNDGVFRPDRIIITGNKVTIVDYKSGRASEEHKTQMRKYSEIIKRAGYDNIEAFLLYLENYEVVKVS